MSLFCHKFRIHKSIIFPRYPFLQTMARNESRPEYYIPIDLAVTNKNDSDGESILKFPKSTQKESYSYPKIQRPIVTREKRFEQFLRREIYHEYLRTLEEADNEPTPPPPRTSEYSGRYRKMEESPEVEEKLRKELMYSITENPLYDSHAISYWNQKGKRSKNFKYVHRVTKPVALQDTQFG